jgi:HK97 family phage major capsid protein
MGSNQHHMEKADVWAGSPLHRIAKADLGTSDLSSGGLLAPAQVKEFYELIIDESALLPQVTTVTMPSPTYEISKMGFTSRMLRGATEGSPLPIGDRSKPELGKVQITTQEFIGEARMSYGVIEDNIINGTFVDYAMRLAAKRIATDMEDIVINGDTASAIDPLNKMDGVLKQATSLVVNAGGVRLDKSTLKKIVQTLPSRYLKSQKNLAFFTSKNAVIDYADSLSNRNTALGDEKLLRVSQAEYMGYPIIPVPMFPEDLGGGSNMTSLLFLDPKNIHVGMTREVRIETTRDISARELIMVVTVRFGVKYQHEPALVKATNILASAG